MGKKKRRRSASARRNHHAARSTPAVAREATAEISSSVHADASADADADADADVGTNADACVSAPSPAEPPAAASLPARVSSPARAVSIASIARGHAIPRGMTLALVASVGAALLSTGVAVFVVLRHGGSSDEAGLVRNAAAATVQTDAVPIASVASTTVPSSTPPAAEPEPPGLTQWPDLALDVLPPVGAAPAHLGQSVGSPRDGALLAPTRLPNGSDYVIRNENTAWGTSNTIEHLRTAMRALRRRHPAIDRVVIGDISTRRGGPLSGHTSHQSGRDVDVGLVGRGRPEDAPAEFVEATRDNLDRRATYDLIAELATTRNDPSGVELIVLDYGLQRLLRKSAAARGVPEAELEALFQFPHGPNSRHGLVRHKPAHRDHMHVRFGCPPDDAYCRSPLIGFAGMEAEQPDAEPSSVF